MASINYAHKEIISKIVYYGPGLSGKTTNLQFVFKKIPAETRGELISLATDADRTLYFDFLPVNVGSIQGFATKFQLYTVPGQVYYNATRKLVLRGVDGVVFVADSQREKADENVESLQNLKDNLEEYGYDITTIPLIIQYNKRDLPGAMELADLEKLLNPQGWPYFEAVASTGDGVFKTLKAISKLVLEQIRTNKMGAPKTVKAEPVAVGAAVGGSSAAAAPMEPEPVSPPPPVAAPEPETPEQESEVAGIVKDSDTMANVVVSDSQALPEAVEDNADNTEETTERSVLKEVSLDNGESGDSEERSGNAADDDSGEISRGPIYGTIDDGNSFDEEATQLSNLSLKNPLSLAKPQMAESRKVKGKKGKSGLFGLFGKSKK